MTNPPLRTRDGRTRTARIGLATAVVALSSLSACSMWHGMTDRIAGRGTSSDTARATRPATSTAGPSGGTWGGGAGMPSGATGAASGATGGSARDPSGMAGVQGATGAGGAYGTPGTAAAPGGMGAPGMSGARSMSGSPGVPVTADGAAVPAGPVVPGADVSRMRGPTLPPTAGRGAPTFRSYNECRSWLAQQGRMANRGPSFGGEITMSDIDPCRDMPRS